MKLLFYLQRYPAHPASLLLSLLINTLLLGTRAGFSTPRYPAQLTGQDIWNCRQLVCHGGLPWLVKQKIRRFSFLSIFCRRRTRQKLERDLFFFLATLKLETVNINSIRS